MRQTHVFTRKDAQAPPLSAQATFGSAFEVWRVKMTSDGWSVTYQHVQLE